MCATIAYVKIKLLVRRLVHRPGPIQCIWRKRSSTRMYIGNWACPRCICFSTCLTSGCRRHPVKLRR